MKIIQNSLLLLLLLAFALARPMETSEGFLTGSGGTSAQQELKISSGNLAAEEEETTGSAETTKKAETTDEN